MYAKYLYGFASNSNRSPKLDFAFKCPTFGTYALFALNNYLLPKKTSLNMVYMSELNKVSEIFRSTLNGDC